MSGPLPSVSAMKKVLLTAAAAVMWFLPGHLVVLALIVFIWGSAMASTANTAQTRSTAARLATHITNTAPAVNFVANGGSVGGSVTVNGNHTVTGALGVHAGGTVVGGPWTMSNGASVSSGLSSDTITTSSDVTVGGNHTTNGTSTVFGTEGIHGNLNLIGGIGSSYAIPATPPGKITGTGTNSQLTNCCNALIDTLTASGVCT
jgi:hypothetical protein